MHEINRDFVIEVAHSLRRQVDAESSARIHGHSYRVQVAVRGVPDAESGMVLDIGIIDAAIAGVRARLDHHNLDELQGLGPATMENVSRWIFGQLAPALPGLHRVSLFRDLTGNACHYWAD